MKSVALLSFILLSSLLSGCEFTNEKMNLIQVGLNFTAKSMCSCLWVTNNSKEFCDEYTALEEVSPKMDINEASNEVNTSLFWLFSAKAKYVGVKQGCQIFSGHQNL